MGELNFGQLLRRGRNYGASEAIKDLGTGYRATYAEHLERIGRLSGAIAELGVRPDRSVAVLAGSSHVYIELWRACCGGAAVINPLNNRLAAEELVYILNDSGSEVLFADAEHAPIIASLRDRLPELRAVVLVGEGDVPHDYRLNDLMAAASPELPMEPGPEDAAVLMYTGGTTGLPKGVVLSQRALVLAIYRMQPVVSLGPQQRFLSFMPMFHIGGMSAWALLLPNGGCTVMMPGFDASAVNAAIRDEHITVIGAVPTMLAMMVDHADYSPSMLNSIELVMYGAAPMPAPLLGGLMETCPNMGFHQAYGMTESAAIVTGLTRNDHHEGGDILASVGRAMLGVEIDIRDPETATPLTQGEIGEIWIRADSIMTEYWNKPEQTEASIVDGWYKTGDAAHRDERGFVFLADRVKDMIVTGGENVYSLEVENALVDHPAVNAVAVVGLADDKWGERVHAVVVCEPNSVTADELSAHARQRIAGFKVPRTWTMRQEPLPLSAAGKVLKRDLREQLA